MSADLSTPFWWEFHSRRMVYWILTLLKLTHRRIPFATTWSLTAWMLSTVQKTAINNQGVVQLSGRVLDSQSKGRGFHSRQEQQHGFRVHTCCYCSSQNPCQKCRWQLITYAPYLCGSEVTLNWCRAVWCTQNMRQDGTSHVTTKQHCKYTAATDIQKCALYR